MSKFQMIKGSKCLIMTVALTAFLTGCAGNRYVSAMPEVMMENSAFGKIMVKTVQKADTKQKANENKTNENKTNENKTNEKTFPEQVLHFVDAWGEWHDAKISANVEKHPYQWKYLKNENGAISYEGDSNYYIRKGVDVSHHQGNIQWNKVKEQGYDFAIVRMAYRGYGKSGKLMLDREYRNNLLKAKKAGLEVGVYVFSQAINEKEAVEEANIIINHLNGITLDLPIVFDPELIRNDVARTDNVTGEQFTQNAIAFCETVKKAGYEPMIYSNMVWEAEIFDMEKLKDYPIWYADYEKIPQTPYQFSFWQCSESGRVNGISGNTDIDIQFCKKKINN